MLFVLLWSNRRIGIPPIGYRLDDKKCIRNVFEGMDPRLHTDRPNGVHRRISFEVTVNFVEMIIYNTLMINQKASMHVPFKLM